MASACTQATNFGAGPVGNQQLSTGTGGGPIPGTGPTCQPGTTSKVLPTKFLFIVDQSGSNVDGPYEHPGQATDPQKAFRDGVISEFVSEQTGKAGLSWGFISFGDTVNAYINNGSTAHPAFSDMNAMRSALSMFMASSDVGGTSYRLALAAAHDLIQSDIAANGSTYSYRIAFLTDGYPTDYCPDPTQTSCPTTMLEGQIDADVANIINLAPNGVVQMGTVYYGFPDANAEARLQRMAADGHGQFVDTNVTKQITLNNVIQVPTTCP